MNVSEQSGYCAWIQKIPICKSPSATILTTTVALTILVGIASFFLLLNATGTLPLYFLPDIGTVPAAFLFTTFTLAILIEVSSIILWLCLQTHKQIEKIPSTSTTNTSTLLVDDPDSDSDDDDDGVHSWDSTTTTPDERKEPEVATPIIFNESNAFAPFLKKLLECVEKNSSLLNVKSATFDIAKLASDSNVHYPIPDCADDIPRQVLPMICQAMHIFALDDEAFLDTPISELKKLDEDIAFNDSKYLRFVFAILCKRGALLRKKLTNIKEAGEGKAADTITLRQFFSLKEAELVLWTKEENCPKTLLFLLTLPQLLYLFNAIQAEEERKKLIANTFSSFDILWDKFRLNNLVTKDANPLLPFMEAKHLQLLDDTIVLDNDFNINLIPAAHIDMLFIDFTIEGTPYTRSSRLKSLHMLRVVNERITDLSSFLLSNLLKNCPWGGGTELKLASISAKTLNEIFSVNLTDGQTTNYKKRYEDARALIDIIPPRFINALVKNFNGWSLALLSKEQWAEVDTLKGLDLENLLNQLAIIGKFLENKKFIEEFFQIIGFQKIKESLLNIPTTYLKYIPLEYFKKDLSISRLTAEAIKDGLFYLNLKAITWTDDDKVQYKKSKKCIRIIQIEEINEDLYHKLDGPRLALLSKKQHRMLDLNKLTLEQIGIMFQTALLIPACLGRKPVMAVEHNKLFVRLPKPIPEKLKSAVPIRGN